MGAERGGDGLGAEMVILQKASFETARVDIMGIDPFYHPPSIDRFSHWLDASKELCIFKAREIEC